MLRPNAARKRWEKDGKKDGGQVNKITYLMNN
jgi:hypothetical protein